VDEVEEILARRAESDMNRLNPEEDMNDNDDIDTEGNE
jgi:hypothetical protein